jgi:hypothetical protein
MPSQCHVLGAAWTNLHLLHGHASRRQRGGAAACGHQLIAQCQQPLLVTPRTRAGRVNAGDCEQASTLATRLAQVDKALLVKD